MKCLGVAIILLAGVFASHAEAQRSEDYPSGLSRSSCHLALGGPLTSRRDWSGNICRSVSSNPS